MAIQEDFQKLWLTIPHKLNTCAKAAICEMQEEFKGIVANYTRRKDLSAKEKDATQAKRRLQKDIDVAWINLIEAWNIEFDEPEEVDDDDVVENEAIDADEIATNDSDYETVSDSDVSNGNELEKLDDNVIWSKENDLYELATIDSDYETVSNSDISDENEPE
jgi:hypothetical protein